LIADALVPEETNERNEREEETSCEQRVLLKIVSVNGYQRGDGNARCDQPGLFSEESFRDEEDGKDYDRAG